MMKVAIEKQEYMCVGFCRARHGQVHHRQGGSSRASCEELGEPVGCKVVRLCEVEQPDVKGYGLPPQGNIATSQDGVQSALLGDRHREGW